MELFKDVLVDIISSIANDKCKEKLDKFKIKESVESYLENESKYNEASMLAEEIDFEGICIYLKGDFVCDAIKYLKQTNKTERDRIRKDILSKAVVASQADTEKARKRSNRIASNTLEIVKKYFTKSFSVKDCLLITEGVTQINNNVDNRFDELKSMIDELNNNVRSNRNEIDNPKDLEEKIRSLLDFGSLDHELKPYYKFEYSNGMLFSKPAIPEALTKYPPSIAVKGELKNIHFDGDYDKLYDYAYRHQVNLELDVTDAKKLLGNKLDPIQTEVEGMVGSEMTYYPPEFPPAIPCSIQIDQETIFDYMELRTKEILDDGTYVVYNELKTGISLEIRFNPDRDLNVDFSIKLDRPSHKELLDYLRFKQAYCNGCSITVKMLKNGKPLLSGKKRGDTKEDITELNDRIDFLKKIIVLEDWFKVSFDIYNPITEEDYNMVCYLHSLVKNGKYSHGWKDTTLTFNNIADFRDTLNAMESDMPLYFAYDGTAQVSLLKAKLSYKLRKTYNSVKIANLDSIKKLANELNEGEEIKVPLLACDDAEIVDLYNNIKP